MLQVFGFELHLGALGLSFTRRGLLPGNTTSPYVHKQNSHGKRQPVHSSMRTGRAGCFILVLMKAVPLLLSLLFTLCVLSGLMFFDCGEGSTFQPAGDLD